MSRNVKLGCCVDGKCSPHTCMHLPEGKTCGDCVHLSRCLAFGFTRSPERTSCDFYPRRFVVRETSNAYTSIVDELARRILRIAHERPEILQSSVAFDMFKFGLECSDLGPNLLQANAALEVARRRQREGRS